MKPQMKHLRSRVEIKEADRVITVIASDETLDRHGDVLPIDQWDLGKFKSAPRMLVDHNHEVSSIVGKWVNPRIEAGKLLMDADFHGFTELSRAVQDMVRSGYLNTVSVGFIPHGPQKDGGTDTFELIETSWVTVPANPNATIQASLKQLVDKQTSEEEAKKIKDFIGDEELGEDGEPVVPEDDDAEDAEDTDIPPVFAEGEVPVATMEAFQKIVKGEDKLSVVCDYDFVSGLIADSVALTQLTAAGKQAGKASEDAKMIKLAVREAATLINQTLRTLNGVK